MKNKTPSVISLVTTAAFNVKSREIENKISDATRLVTKTDCNTKTTTIENQIPGVSSFDTKLRSITSKATSFKTRQVHDLAKEVGVISIKELTKELINEYNILNGAKCFADDGSQFFFFNDISTNF